MKKHYASLAILASISVICSSCVAPSAGYATYTSPSGGISAGIAWTKANYDSSGFPIFGYSYGKPVYGYSASGSAIFSIAALTALSYVPHWAPASWYRGSFRYPVGIHRVSAPPRCPSGHCPGMRPSGAPVPPPPGKQHAPQPHLHPAQPSLHMPGGSVAHLASAHKAPAARHLIARPQQHGRAMHSGAQRAHADHNKPGTLHGFAHSGGFNKQHGSLNQQHYVRTMPAPAGQRIAALSSAGGMQRGDHPGKMERFGRR